MGVLTTHGYETPNLGGKTQVTPYPCSALPRTWSRNCEPSLVTCTHEGSVTVSPNLLVGQPIQSIGGFILETFRREHHLVFIVITINLVVDTSGQGIWLGRVLAGSVGERVVKSRQVE